MTTCVHLTVYEDIVWVCPQGEIDSATVPLLEDAFWLARSYHSPRTYLDFSNLNFISSSGLREIIYALAQLRRSGSQLIIGRVSEPVREMLQALGLEHLLVMLPMVRPADTEIQLSGLIVPGQLAELKTVRDFMDTVISRIQYAEKAGFGLKMAVDELVSNIVRHNYKDLGPKPVTVLLAYKNDILEASVIDQGFAFDPTSFQTRDMEKTIEGGHIGGMGINLVRILSDEFAYISQEGHNISQLRKSIAVIGNR